MAKSNEKVESGEDKLYKLSIPFRESEVKWRVGREMSWGDTMVLAYVDVNTVRDRLNEVMGCDWQCKHITFGTKNVCHLGLKLNGEWVWRSDGAGDTKFEGEKGGLSDALKRAAVSFGVGRHLYDLGDVFIKKTDFIKKKNGDYTKTPNPAACWDVVRRNKSDFS